jgi:DDE domain
MHAAAIVITSYNANDDGLWKGKRLQLRDPILKAPEAHCPPPLLLFSSALILCSSSSVSIAVWSGVGSQHFLHIGHCYTGQRLNSMSRMRGDAHVRICESLGVQFPRATRLYLKISGRMVYLWRAVDAEGEVLDVLVQSKRNKRAALKLMRELLKKYGFVPDKLVTDDLKILCCCSQ